MSCSMSYGLGHDQVEQIFPFLAVTFLFYLVRSYDSYKVGGKMIYLMWMVETWQYFDTS